MTRAVRPRTLRRIASRERQRGYLGLNSYRRLAASALSGPAFAASLLTSIVPDKAAPGTAPTFTRATTKTFTDWEGRVRTALAGEACFTGARRVRNFVTGSSNDITNAAWAKNQGGVGVAPTATANFAIAPDGTATASRVQFAPGGTGSDYSRIQHLLGSPGIAGGRTSIWLRTNDATTKLMKLRSASASADELTVTVTGTWQRFAGPVNTNAASAVEVYTDGTLNSGAAVDLLVWGAQWEDLRGASNQNPAEYVSVGVLSAPYQGANVDGVQYFATQNGNTVASNVVTAGTGAAIASSVLLGYSAWQASTNLVLQSADMSTTWAPSNLTVGGSITLPDGSTGVKNKLLLTATAAVTHNVLQAFTKAASALAYTYTAYAKVGEYAFLAFRIDSGAGNGCHCSFNLTTGAVGTAATGDGTPFTGLSSSITPAGDGWFRCQIGFTTDTATTVRVVPTVQDADGNPFSYTFTATLNSGLYLWGAQLEQLAFATPYIPTTTAAVTRNVDVLTNPSAGNMSGATGTCYAEATSNGTAGLVAFFVGTDTNGRLLETSAVTNIRAIDNGAANIAVKNLIQNWAVAGAAPKKIASSWGGTSLKVTSEGQVPAAGASFTVMSTANPIGIGNLNTGSNVINGNIRNVAIWTRALTDAQLQAMTT